MLFSFQLPGFPQEKNRKKLHHYCGLFFLLFIVFLANFSFCQVYESATYLYFQFVIFDGIANSTACSVTFNSTVNIPPTATAAGPITTLEGSASSVFNITGVDPDSSYAVKVISLPFLSYSVNFLFHYCLLD